MDGSNAALAKMPINIAGIAIPNLPLIEGQGERYEIGSKAVGEICSYPSGSVSELKRSNECWEVTGVQSYLKRPTTAEQQSHSPLPPQT